MGMRAPARRPHHGTIDSSALLVHHQLAVGCLQLQRRRQRQPGISTVAVGGAWLTDSWRGAGQGPAWRFQLAGRAIEKQAIALHLELRSVPVKVAEPRRHVASEAVDKTGVTGSGICQHLEVLRQSLAAGRHARTIRKTRATRENA